MRHFNISGPCDPVMHYMVPPEARTPDLSGYLARNAYFVVHAPRQSGKTTALRAFAERLTREGRYTALHFSCEAARAFSDIAAAEERVWLAIEEAAVQRLPPELRPPPSADTRTGGFVSVQLRRWAEQSPRPLVLVFDEIDALEGAPLKSVLSQLRDGYPNRPRHFPAVVILCGMKDIRDYKLASGSASPAYAGSSSPFNIKERSLRLPNFSEAEVRDLYAQHTAETGQPITDEAVARAFELSQGQPWLSNALVFEVIVAMGVAPPAPITAAHVDAAKERLIVGRATHLDSLLARLQEDRVRAVIEPIIAGELPHGDPLDDDYTYVRDLGLIAVDEPPRFANPIYEEVVLRVLATGAERAVMIKPRSMLAPDGRLDMRRVLEGFASFWRENGEILLGRMPYPEAAPLLVMMAWLHRFGNGQGGVIDREIGVGTKRVDLQLRWPHVGSNGERLWQREAFELKVWRDRDKRRDPTVTGLQQIDGYLERLGLDHGTLVVFDARAAAPPIEDRTTLETVTAPSGRVITLLRA